MVRRVVAGVAARFLESIQPQFLQMPRQFLLHGGEFLFQHSDFLLHGWDIDLRFRLEGVHVTRNVQVEIVLLLDLIQRGRVGVFLDLREGLEGRDDLVDVPGRRRFWFLPSSNSRLASMKRMCSSRCDPA